MVKYEGRYPTGPNGEYLPSYDVAVGCVAGGTDAQRLAALTDLRKFQTPPTTRQVEGWLAELSVITAGRGREGFDAELMLSAYAARLSQYPADVARYALLGRSWKWFPTWAELQQVCNALAAPRRHMIQALSQPAPEPEAKRRPPTQAERERIAALVAEKFPSVSAEWRERAVSEALKGDCMADGAPAEKKCS